MKVLSICVCVSLVAMVAGHAALFIPPSRNADDRNLPSFAGGRSPQTPCTCANGLCPGDNVVHGTCPNGCDQGLRAGGGGQPCLWFSQGCSIGCDKCATAADGTAPIRGKAPHADKIGFRTRYCESTVEANLPRRAWTMNVHAVEGSVEDSYRFNPWRRPGSAPVVDACGQAGGKFERTPIGGDSVYTNTSLAHMGDFGSKLPASPDPARWAAGSEVDVAWGIRYNHGGGYQYRLCPVGEPLTEACFQRTPLEFVRSAHALLWTSDMGADGPRNGTRLSLPGVWVDTGTTPPGSTWARNPIPRIADDNRGLANASSCPGPTGRSGPGCVQFKPPCEEDTGPYPWSTDGSGQGACSGDWTAGLITDKVKVPAGLKGRYVLGWRYDCEETAQVWLNCADVVIA